MIRPKRKFWSTWSVPYIGVAAILVALVPIAIEPILNSQKYSEYSSVDTFNSMNYFPLINTMTLTPVSLENIQKTTRAGINQEEVQPGSKCRTIH